MWFSSLDRSFFSSLPHLDESLSDLDEEAFFVDGQFMCGAVAVLDVWATVVAVMKCKICMAHVL